MQLIIDSKLITVPLDKISNKLKTANEFQRNLYKISPSGCGIRWPLIDEDLSVDACIIQAIEKSTSSVD